MSVVSCRGLTKNYSNFTALNSLDLEIQSGRIVGLLGPNGSGKSTFIKLCAGLLKPTFGELTVTGYPVGPESKKRVSYLPDRDYLPERMKVKELLKLFSDFYSDFSMQRAMDMLTRLGIDFTKSFKTMSKGTREKVQLALVMSRDADLYLLDEPIAAVDPAAREYILTTILQNYREGATVLISTHLITDVEPILDDVIMLQNGMLRIAGTAEQIRNESGMSIDGLFREVYRC
ncbi:MAG: ABC transporter ATP-binding protein [Ruminococcus sp.]|nr:ABC transporter ATP-binding protein [Ruminococcus sp.]